jgi:hypothetical protein
VASYADVEAVQARAGVLSTAWTATSSPSLTDIAGFLDDIAAEIDAALGGRSLTAPAAGSVAANALKNGNALGALVLALQATFPEGSGPASASKQIDSARAEYEALMAAIMDGTHPAVRLLEAGAASARATTFWHNEPQYGLFPYDPRLDPLAPDANPNTAPTVARGQSL